MKEFKDLGLSESTIQVLKNKGYVKPTSIQERAIPVLLEGNVDVVGQSQTGTGKTASFGVPIIELIKKGKHVQAIILTPTRELAIQVSKEIDSLKGKKDLRTVAIFGGAPITTQIRKLREGIEIVVGTPGRVIDLINRGVLKLGQISFAVLDEADEMLNMGFVEDIEEILQKTPKEKRMLLFSATMPKEIMTIARRFMKDYEIILSESKQKTIDLTEQIYFDVMSNDRFEALRRIIDTSEFYGIVFCKTREDVDVLTNKLKKSNYNGEALHGDISQAQREKILDLFRKKAVNILVATDVAARGIDVDDLTHVINYSLPQSPESYIHRIGRTGRAGKKGVAITFVIPSEKRKLMFIERLVEKRLIKKELPTIEEVLKIKQERMMSIIQDFVGNYRPSKYDQLAKELLKEYGDKIVVASLLKFAFQKELGTDNYRDIRNVKADRSGRNRRSGKGDNRRGPRRSDRMSNSRRSPRGGPDRKRNPSRENSRIRSSKPEGRSARNRSDRKSDSGRKKRRDTKGSPKKGNYRKGRR